MSGHDAVRRGCLQAAFWVPLMVCTYLALTPNPPEPVTRMSDVALHGVSFVYLTFAARLAFPGARPITLALWMLGYGAFLELAQSFEPQRDAELKDLLVDLGGIAAGLAAGRLLGDRVRGAVRTLLGPPPG